MSANFLPPKKPVSIFGKTPAFVSTNALISDSGVRLFAFMASFLTYSPIFWSGNKFCARGLGWGCPKKVRRCLKELIRAKAISVHRHRPGGVVEYCLHFNEPPQHGPFLPQGRTALGVGQDSPTVGAELPHNVDPIVDPTEEPPNPPADTSDKAQETGGDFGKELAATYEAQSPTMEAIPHELSEWIEVAGRKFGAQLVKRATLGAANDDFHNGRSGERRQSLHRALKSLLTSREKLEDFAARYENQTGNTEKHQAIAAKRAQARAKMDAEYAAITAKRDATTQDASEVFFAILNKRVPLDTLTEAKAALAAVEVNL